MFQAGVSGLRKQCWWDASGLTLTDSGGYSEVSGCPAGVYVSRSVSHCPALKSVLNIVIIITAQNKHTRLNLHWSWVHSHSNIFLFPGSLSNNFHDQEFISLIEKQPAWLIVLKSFSYFTFSMTALMMISLFFPLLSSWMNERINELTSPFHLELLVTSLILFPIFSASLLFLFSSFASSSPALTPFSSFSPLLCVLPSHSFQPLGLR